MTRVLLFTDQAILAKGLEAVFSGVGEIQLAGVCSDPAELIRTLAGDPPDLLLIDLSPEVTFALLSQLRLVGSACKVVLWTSNITTELGFQAMGLGVRGILRKSLPAEVQVKCLEKVQSGELWFEKSLTDSFLAAKRVVLTKREGELVTLLAQGMKNREIASALEISEGTVKVYLSRLFQKLRVKDRFELALFGIKNLTNGQALGTGKQAGNGTAPAGLRSLVLEQQTVRPAAPAPFLVRRPQPVRHDVN